MVITRKRSQILLKVHRPRMGLKFSQRKTCTIDLLKYVIGYIQIKVLLLRGFTDLCMRVCLHVYVVV